MGIVTVQWVLFGYALAFGPRGDASEMGGGDRSWFALDFGYITNSFYDATFPLYTHSAFQCAFAVITPALISGVVVNKMKPASFCIFVLLWTTIVYDVIAFWIWNPQGWLHEYGALDFAGGTVIHISSGFSALVCSFFLRDKSAVEHEPPSQNLPMTVLGGGILWFGWMGFNAGSATSAGNLAALALINTNAAAASALLTFVALERLVDGKATVLGGISGAVVGLVVITPAAGFVRPGWALLMGIWGTIMVYGGIVLKRKWTKLDDPLDVFSCHGMGGVYGSLLTGLFCEAVVNPAGGFDGAFYGNPRQLWNQIAAVLVVIAYACSVTAGLCTLLHFTLGLKISKLEAQMGMDTNLTSFVHVDENLHLDQAMVKVRKALSGHKNVDFTEKEEAYLHHVFSLIDDQHTGQISLPKFLAALRMMSIALPKEEAAVLFARFDADRNGAIEFEEFRLMMLQANRVSQRHSIIKSQPDDIEMTAAEVPVVGESMIGAEVPLVGEQAAWANS